MCIPGLDPLTLLGVLGGVGSAVAGAATAFSGPPEAAIPAPPAPTLQDSGATIRIGDNGASDDNINSTAFTPLELSRSSGRSLGGLGRSGLAL